MQHNSLVTNSSNKKCFMDEVETLPASCTWQGSKGENKGACLRQDYVVCKIRSCSWKNGKMNFSKKSHFLKNVFKFKAR